MIQNNIRTTKYKSLCKKSNIVKKCVSVNLHIGINIKSKETSANPKVGYDQFHKSAYSILKKYVGRL